MHGGICSVLAIFFKMNTLIQVQALDKAVWISHRSNPHVKRYAFNYSSSSYKQIVGKNGLINHGMATTPGEGKTRFKPVVK